MDETFDISNWKQIKREFFYLKLKINFRYYFILYPYGSITVSILIGIALLVTLFPLPVTKSSIITWLSSGSNIVSLAVGCFTSPLMFRRTSYVRDKKPLSYNQMLWLKKHTSLDSLKYILNYFEKIQSSITGNDNLYFSTIIGKQFITYYESTYLEYIQNHDFEKTKKLQKSLISLKENDLLQNKTIFKKNVVHKKNIL